MAWYMSSLFVVNHIILAHIKSITITDYINRLCVIWSILSRSTVGVVLELVLSKQRYE